MRSEENGEKLGSPSFHEILLLDQLKDCILSSMKHHALTN